MAFRLRVPVNRQTDGTTNGQTSGPGEMLNAAF